MQTQPSAKKRVKPVRYGDIAFHTVNYTLISLLTFMCLFPFLNTFANAFSSDHAIQAGKVLIWPVEPQWDAMRAVLLDQNVLKAMGVTVYTTVFGTLLNMVATILTAYPLSRRDLKWRGYFMNYMIFTMMFGGGMIPGYLLIKSLGLLNTYWVLMIPGLVGAFNVIIMKTFFQNMPDELREAAVVDGCSNIRYLLTVVLPLSGAVLATIGLFYAVGHWNSYSAALIYNDDPKYWTLQVHLRNVLLLSQMDTSLETMQEENELNVIAESLKAAVIVFATVPILIVYPFLQKYFVKGALLGSVKG
ncbi:MULTISPECIES: carbohydrate ABC transporter permease [unclassified Paenibacillus]|uniref:carbohydrate ABC transporter permease n=1 Tax=unclassified Paenibacillus TaxID=185978 RepID=UPI00210B96D7|nr:MULTISPECIES: carbohydrate ABC transporter permease [unclassified Paenibacillus]